MKLNLSDPEKETKILSVSGMYCTGCAARIENVLRKMNGITEVKVNFAVQTAIVEFDPTKIQLNEIQEKVKKLGYESSVRESFFTKDRIDRIKKQKKEDIKEILLFIFSFILGFPLLLHMFLDFHIDPLIQFFLATPVQFISGFRFHKSAWKTIRTWDANMDVLVSLGTNVAYFYSVYLLFFSNSHLEVYFESSAMVITFVLLGKILEGISKRKARQSIEELFSLQPLICHRITGNIIEDIDISLLKKGDKILIRPSENIPSDGIVIEGISEVNESLITGESLPVLKKIGDKVFSGTTNLSGMLKIEIIEEPENSTLSKILYLVEKTQNSKAPIQKLADQISGYFAYIVIFLSILNFLISFFVFALPFSKALIHSVSVLVIACPCALGLATPIAILVASGMAAKNGILFQNAESLETLGKVNSLVFDKTGTLTQGNFSVIKYLIFDKDHNSLSKEEEEIVLKIIEVSENASEHIVAQSIVKFIKEKKIDKVLKLHLLENFTGSGIFTKVSYLDKEYALYIGNEDFIKDYAKELEIFNNLQKYKNQKYLNVFFYIKDLYYGVFFLEDKIRENAKDLVQYLKYQKIETILVSGDKKNIAENVAKELGISNFYSEAKPEEKLIIIDQLKSHNKIVGMIGDGLNDAPSLAKADVSIAMGTGVSISKELADINLIHNDLLDIGYAIYLSKKTVRKIKENLFFAFIYNIIGIPMAMMGYLSPAYAGFAMGMSSVSVVLSSLILYFNSKENFIKKFIK